MEVGDIQAPCGNPSSSFSTSITSEAKNANYPDSEHQTDF